MLPKRSPTVSDFWRAWRRDHEAGLEPELPPAYASRSLYGSDIPNDLLWREGQYAHQGRAVEALLRQDIGGIISIATGGGKTYVALIAATEIQNATPRHICVVVLVPSLPLVRQWTEGHPRLWNRSNRASVESPLKTASQNLSVSSLHLQPSNQEPKCSS